MLVQFQPELPDLRRGDGIWHTYLAQTQGLAGSTPAPGTNSSWVRIVRSIAPDL